MVMRQKVDITQPRIIFLSNRGICTVQVPVDLDCTMYEHLINDVLTYSIKVRVVQSVVVIEVLVVLQPGCTCVRGTCTSRRNPKTPHEGTRVRLPVDTPHTNDAIAIEYSYKYYVPDPVGVNLL
jgi:hypothetical protein